MGVGLMRGLLVAWIVEVTEGESGRGSDRDQAAAGRPQMLAGMSPGDRDA